MAATSSADLFAPEVWADATQAAFHGRSVMQNAAQTDDELSGQPGDTVNFPKWAPLGDLDDLTELVPIEPEKMTQFASAARIKEAGKGVEISDTAKLVGIGNPQDEAIRQLGILTAKKIDKDLYASATGTVTGGITYADGTASTDSAPLSYNAGLGNGISWGALVDAAGVFEDDFEPSEFSGLYITATDRGLIMKDDQFIRAQQGANGNALIQRGLIGDINGLPVFVTNRVEAGKSLLMKNNALGLKYKRRPIVEQDRDISTRSTLVTTNLHYATHRINDKGVLVINWNTAE